MKKSGLLFVFISIILLTSFITAANETVEDKALDCIKEKIDNNCNSFSLEERIYSFLTAGLCKDSILNNSIEVNGNNTCWGESGTCDIELTSKALYALSKRGSQIDESVNWLISQNKTETEMQWFLQIINSEASSCTVNYAGDTYNLEISEEGRISSNNLGNCLSPSAGNWWMSISSTCHDEKFSISCDKSFNTNLLYQATDSSTIHVLEDLQTASGEYGNITEQIKSFCFKGANGFCDYGGTLWATLVLDYLGEDVDNYFPYINSQKDNEEYSKYLPESFLYLLTGEEEFQIEIIEGQLPSGYWDENSGEGKYYDTAVALQSFYSGDLVEKEKTKQALEKEQGENGCWNNNVRDTGIILHSIYGIRTSVSSGDSGITRSLCEDASGYCMADYSCLEVQGQELGNYYCEGAYDVCCDTPLNLETCADKGGVICNSNQECSGTEEDVEGLFYGETCCIGGSCNDVSPQDTTTNTCLENNGNCRYSCEDDEDETSAYSCSDESRVCCMEKEGGSLWWIWLLLILIIFVVLGIIFREKLRPFYMRIKSNKFISNLLSKFSKKSGSNNPVQKRPGFSGMRRPMPPRRMQPPVARRSMHPPQAKRPPAQKQNEKDDILSKLRDLGK